MQLSRQQFCELQYTFKMEAVRITLFKTSQEVKPHLHTFPANCFALFHFQYVTHTFFSLAFCWFYIAFALVVAKEIVFCNKALTS